MTKYKNIAIICAMQEELDSIIKTLKIQNIYSGSNANNSNINNAFYYQTAEYRDQKLIFLLCGIGKVHAAIHTQYILCNQSIDLVINVGVAGGINNCLNFGDVVIANDLVYHDFDVTAFGLPLGQVPSLDVYSFACDQELIKIAQSTPSDSYQIITGRIATGDQFIDNNKMAMDIAQGLTAIACEMEGAAIAHTCYLNQVPCLIVRAISDLAGQNTQSAADSFNQLKNMAADRASSIINHILKHLNILNSRLIKD